jgi:hypothetical protein
MCQKPMATFLRGFFGRKKCDFGVVIAHNVDSFRQISEWKLAKFQIK